MKEPVYFDTQNFGVEEPFFVDDLILDHPFPLHRHSFAEFEYIVDGEGIDKINGIEYPLRKGSISFKLSWHAHELVPEKNSKLHIYKCSFRQVFFESGGTLKNLSDLSLQCYDFPPVAYLSPEEQLRFEKIYQDMLDERKSVSPWKSELVCAKVSELLILFLRNVFFARENKENKTKSTDHFNVWSIVKLINLRYSEENLNCKDVAGQHFYSESYVNKTLKDHTGLSFHDLLQEIRVRNACNYLIYTDDPVEKIAKETGFKNRNSLYEAFETVKGLSPVNYRKRFRSSDKDKSYFGSLDKVYSDVIYYLHNHYYEDLTLERVAKEFHYNKMYFCDMLSSNGTTFGDLLSEIRIFNACRLLLISDLPISLIGEKTGFSSQETFFRTFKKLRGTTPNEYRKKNMTGQKKEE